MDNLKIIIANNKKLLKEFIYFPEKLYKGYEKWVPPIYSQEMDYFNPQKNKGLNYCTFYPILCYQNNRLVGRILGINNHRYNKLSGTNTVRFSHFECIDNFEVAKALFSHFEHWAQEQNATNIYGPAGMYYTDPVGYIIKGFENEPSISQYYNYPYLTQFLEELHYVKKYDLVAYKIDLSNDIPAFYERIYNRIIKNSNIRIHHYKRIKAIKKDLPHLFNILNECYKDIDNYGWMDKDDTNRLAELFLPILDPRFLKMVSVNNEFAGFIVGMPNISQGIRKAKGRLTPWVLYQILSYKRKGSQLDLLLGGISKKHQGKGLDVLLGYSILNEAKSAGFRIIDSHLEMETNYKVRAEMHKINGEVYKEYRLYEKAISKI